MQSKIDFPIPPKIQSIAQRTKARRKKTSAKKKDKMDIEENLKDYMSSDD